MTLYVRATDRFTATFGTTPGYGHDNEEQVTPEEFVDVWDRYASEVRIRGAGWYYVAATVTSSKVVYPPTAGCPYGGEDIFVVMGVRNPLYCAIPEFWKMSVIEVVEAVRKHYKQTTAQVVFDKVEAHYTREEETDGEG